MGDPESDELYRQAYYGGHPPACTCNECAQRRLAAQTGEDPFTAERHALERRWEARQARESREAKQRRFRDFVGPAILTAILTAILLLVLGIVWAFDHL